MYIKSLRNNFSTIKEVIFNKIDTYFFSEAKFDESYPILQFFADGCRMFRKDHYINMVY